MSCIFIRVYQSDSVKSLILMRNLFFNHNYCFCYDFNCHYCYDCDKDKEGAIINAISLLPCLVSDRIKSFPALMTASICWKHTHTHTHTHIHTHTHTHHTTSHKHAHTHAHTNTNTHTHKITIKDRNTDSSVEFLEIREEKKNLTCVFIQCYLC